MIIRSKKELDIKDLETEPNFLKMSDAEIVDYMKETEMFALNLPDGRSFTLKEKENK
jgi:hypothetical protein